MICENCKRRQAEVSVTKVDKGIKRKVLLCNECHRALRADTAVPDLFDALNGLLSNFVGMSASPRKHVCKACGTSNYEVLDSGYVGCPECYKEFSDILMPYIEKSQVKIEHTGKRPEIDSNDREYYQLIDALHRARLEGRNEDAAKIVMRLNEIVGGAK